MSWLTPDARRLRTVALLGLLLAMANTARAATPTLVLPAGYALPELASPAPDPHAPARWVEQAFAFAGPDRVMYRHCLDNTPGRWLEGLAQVWVGDGVGWSPESRYAVYPLGLVDEDGHPSAVALLGDRVLRFEGSFHHQPEARLQAAPPDQAEIFFEAMELVVHDRKRGRHYRFAPVMINAQPHWRLVAMGWTARPAAITRLERDAAGKLIAIHLPNDVALAVTHTNGQVSRMELPFGRWATFARDPNGHLTEMSVHEAGEPGQSPPRRVEQIQFVCDARGRLERVQTEPRVIWTVELEPPSDPPLAAHETMVLLRCSGQRGALFFHEAHQGHGPTAQVIRRSGSMLDGQSPATARDAHAFAARTLHVRQHANAVGGSPADSWWPGHGALERGAAQPVRYQLLRDAVSEDAPNEAHQYDDHGRVIAWKSEDATWHYRYSSAGDLLEARVSGCDGVHRFVTDDWGRIIRHEKPDGSWRQWDFHERGYLIAIREGRTHRWLDDLGSQATRQEDTGETTIHHDRQHRPQRVDFGDGRRWQMLYDSNGRLRSWHDGEAENRYQYDTRGWLARAERVGQGWTGYEHRPDGRLLREQIHLRQQRSRDLGYDPQQRIIREQIQGMGETRYEYDAEGRQARIVHPDGRDTLYTYDALNRIITVRGSHQPPLDIHYDADGQRHITQPARP